MKKLMTDFKRVFFSTDDSPLFIGYYHPETHYGGWPVAYFEKPSVNQVIADFRKFRNQFEIGVDMVEWDADENVLHIQEDGEGFEGIDTEEMIEPLTIDFNGVTKQVYPIGRYCWHIDEYDDVVKQIAVEFSRVLRSWLTSEQMRTVNKLNAAEKGDCCHSHDFCDANMAMWEGLCKVMCYDENEESYTSELHTDLMNAAWVIAKRNKFKV